MQATKVAPLEHHSSDTTVSLTARIGRHGKLLRVLYLDQTLQELLELALPVRARIHALEGLAPTTAELERLTRLERLLAYYRAERKQLGEELGLADSAAELGL